MFQRGKTLARYLVQPLPSLQESKRKANSSTNSLVISLCLREGTSATFPSSPIMFLSKSAFSGKRSWQCRNVSDVTNNNTATYLALEEEIHAATIEKPLAVDRCLVSHIPHRRPSCLHHVVTHLKQGSLSVCRSCCSASCSPPAATCP